uniref:Pentatricopeptide repeat-containing protein n=1 Tax=Saccharum hybrid cultivar R570 TaxID=131158 RepID=A0A059PZC8_9POAL|nr:hypothetical protein SHCRBa_008_G08_F_270 [Saccharum hybrid cultivar R570]
MSRGVKPVHRTCLQLERIIVGRHRSGSLGLEDALNLFDELLPQARPASVHAFNRVLTVVACGDSSSSQRHGAALAVSLFNTMARVGVNKLAADACTFSILMRCFCTVGRLDFALGAFGQFLKTGWRVQVMALNQLIKGLCDGKMTSEAMDIVLRRMPELGCTPYVFSYTILIKGLCDGKRTRDAMDIVLRRMPELGCTPNVFSYNTLIKGLCAEKKSQQALELLLRMTADGGYNCPPNVVSYSMVIDGFFKEGEVDKAYTLFHEMLGRGFPPDLVTYNSVIDGLCKAQAVEKAEAVLQQMFDKGVMPDSWSYNSLIHRYCSLGQLEEAVRLLKKMSGGGLQPNVVT